MSYKLCATRDYGLFEIHTLNRNVENTRGLEQSMRKHGFLPAYPLHVVRAASGKLQIKDGHHRFDVAIRLGLQIYYVVCDDSATLRDINNGVHRWSMRDYFTSFCNAKHADGSNAFPEYTKIREYMDATGIGLQASIAMLGGRGAASGVNVSTFESGTFRVIETEHANVVGDVVLHCVKCGVPFARSMRFVGALSKVIRVPIVDVDRLMRRIQSNPAMMILQPTVNAYIALLESVYNRQSQEKLAISHLAEAVAKNRSVSTACTQKEYAA